MQRIFYSANPDPDKFWQSTFDEVLLVIKGKIDNWRNKRIAAWKIVEGFRGSADMPTVTDFYPLAYDNEIVVQGANEQREDIQEWYKRASLEAENIIWEKDKK